jgi:hypothetical protein
MKSVGYYLRSAADFTEVDREAWKFLYKHAKWAAKKEFWYAVNDLRAAKSLKTEKYANCNFESLDGHAKLMSRPKYYVPDVKGATELQPFKRMKIHEISEDKEY